MSEHFTATKACHCSREHHPLHKIVITGGPGAGKSAFLEMARLHFCNHVALLPEAATILFSGGFWRGKSVHGKETAQRAIFHIQKEMERYVELERKYALAICDRGTLDGLAYWPKSQDSFFDELQISHKKELLSYSAVIHLRTPSQKTGYNLSNPVRIESAREAQELDAKIEKAWKNHPNRYFVESTDSFMEKVEKTFNILRQEVPKCCLSPENELLTLKD